MRLLRLIAVLMFVASSAAAKAEHHVSTCSGGPVARTRKPRARSS
jgi:hypothetical protein